MNGGSPLNWNAGKFVVRGKGVHATGHRFTISANGKRSHSVGTDDEPARRLCRPEPKDPVRTERGHGAYRGTGTIVEPKGK